MSRKQTGIEVQLIGENGNIFNLLAIVRRAMRKNNIEQAMIERFTEEVQASKSYDEALNVIGEYVEIA